MAKQSQNTQATPASAQPTAAAVLEVPASTRIKLTEASSSRLTNHIKGVLTNTTEPMVELNIFTQALAVLTPALSSQIDKLKLPDIKGDDIEAQIKGLETKTAEINTKADAASKDIDDKIKALQAEREEKRKPFVEEASKVNEERGKLTTDLNTRYQPLREAIEKLRTSLTDNAQSILAGGVLKGKEKAELEKRSKEIVEVMLTIEAPNAATSTASKTTSTGTAERGRAAATKLTISKGGESHNFDSFNSARSFVYKLINGEEPKFGANRGACEKFLVSAGWKVETK